MSIPIEDLSGTIYSADLSRISTPHTGDWTHIMLHHTGSASEAGDREWLRRFHANPVSIHDLVLRSGLVQKIIRKTRNAFHAGYSSHDGVDDLTAHALGKEICNRGDGKEKYTDEQYEAVALSVAFDCAYYHIPDRRVISHRAGRLGYEARYPLKTRALKLAGKWSYKTDPLGWEWKRMWARIDQIRANWPKEFGIPLWFDNSGTRQMST